MKGLTERQLQVARLVADNMTIEEIAEHLDIAYGTAKMTIREVRLKLGVDKKRQIPAALRRHGYIN